MWYNRGIVGQVRILGIVYGRGRETERNRHHDTEGATPTFHGYIRKVKLFPHGWGSDLITGCTARLQALSMVPTTVDLPILVKVDQVNQKLVADGAYKAGWMPADAVAST